MDFTKLIQDDLTEVWVQKLFQKLEPYPYLADILVILLSFAAGALLAALLFWILRRILHRFYRRHCEMNPALRDCIRRMLVSFVGCLPVVVVSYNVWCDGMHEWIALLICKPLAEMSISTKRALGFCGFSLSICLMRDAACESLATI